MSEQATQARKPAWPFAPATATRCAGALASELAEKRARRTGSEDVGALRSDAVRGASFFASLVLVVLCSFVAIAFATVTPQETAWAADGSGDSLLLVVDDEGASGEGNLADVDLAVRAKVQGAGWKPAVSSGETAGTKSRKALRALRIKLVDLNG